MKKHFNRKSCCKKTNKNMFLSDDQILCLSLIPYYMNKHNINDNEIKHLENSNIIDKNKNELFEEINTIEKSKSKKCSFCNQEFQLIMDLKKHFIIYCFLDKIKEKNKNNESNLIINNDVDGNNNSLYNKCDVDNTINNTTNNITNNNNNITNIYVEIKQPPISFDNNWNLSQISEGDKSNIMISNFMYTKLLEEILKNEINLNVIIDKEKDSAMVYKDDQYIQMKLKDIIANTMEKLNNHLNEINKEHSNVFEEIIKYTRRMINKKYIDFNNNIQIQEGVKKCMTDIFENKKTEAINVAKNIAEKNIKGF